ncbi:hypothetical protein [phage 023Pt_psg01]|nr:hypothetical protein [phage 023Pt_psg01]
MASEDKDYKQSALGQRVNELMDDGYEFGEAVKQAMSEGLKDGGSVGIEILFGPKVPAAPSQLVSESDILLGYRGDAAYRSGSEQSKSIGQGNVGSQASFGGGQGTDSSGQSEGAGGVNPNQYTSNQQNVNNIKAQLGIKDPNLLQKTFNKYNSLPIGVKAGINTMVPAELMKLFQVGNVLNTGYNQLKKPILTEEDITLEPGALPDLALGATKEISFEGNSPFMRNQIEERIIAAENEYYEQGQMPPEFLGDKIRMNMELGNYDGYMGPGFEDGGRVGFFMGGPALEGEALSIYNSMSAYGNTDQQIADKLQSLGMYTPPGSTPDTPDTTPGNTIGYQGGGGGGGGITTLDPLTRKSTPMDPNSFLGKTFSKVEDFAGSMMDKFSGTTVGEGITEGATKFKNIAITPMMALMNKRNPLNPNASNYNPALQPQMDFLEGITGTKISGMPEDLQFTDGLMMIGRDPNSGLTKYGPGSVLSGKNVVSGFGTNDYGDMLRDYINKMEANTRISQIGKDARLAQARAELAAEQERQRQAYIDAGTQAEVAALQQEIDSGKYSGGSDFAQQNQAAVGGGNTATNAQGQTASQATAAGTGTSQGYSQHYARGGLATMFTRRR